MQYSIQIRKCLPLRWVTLGVMALGLSACVVRPAYVPRPAVVVPAPIPAPVVVRPVAPIAPVIPVAPPLRHEVIPRLPYRGAVWVPGAWHWRDGRHLWVGGHYLRTPRVHPRRHHYIY